MVTGPEPMTQRRQVELIGAATGVDITVEEMSEDQARRRFAGTADPATIEAVLGFVAAAAQGLSPATDTVRRVLGRPATTFAEWARDHADDFRGP
jgi:hypothetical protein